MPPLLLLTALVSTTLMALVISGWIGGRRREQVRRLAGDWRMNFTTVDTLQLAARIASRFPIPGASALYVHNLIYGAVGDHYRYLATVDYTVGVTEAKRRLSCVVAYTEPRDRRRGGQTSLILGEEGIALLDQYRALAARTSTDAGLSKV